MSYTPKTWENGEIIEAEELNHMEQGIAAADAAATGTGTIGTQQLANASVTKQKLATAAVTNDKLDQEAVDSNNIRTGAIITPLIYDGAVTAAKLGTDVQDILDTKADIDGSYESMTVGNAEQLVSSVGIEDSTPYNFRTSGGSTEIGDREKLNAVVGATVAWNQLVTDSSDEVTVQNGHKYVSYIGGTWSAGISTGAAIAVDGANGDKVFDITLALGATVANYAYSLGSAACVSYFLKLFQNAKNALYNSGALLSVRTNLHRMVGFNAYNPTTGTANVVGGNQYQITGAYTALSLDGTTITPDANGKFTPSASGTLTVTGGNSTTTCVHLVWDGERNGEYEPYQEWNYPLDDSLTLRGILKLDASNNLYADGDIYESDGTVDRNFGTESFDGSASGSWSYISTYGSVARFDRSISTLKAGSGANAITNMFVQGAIGTSDLECFNVHGSSNILQIQIATSKLSAVSAAGLMSYFSSHPLEIVYELATPTTETADSYQQTQIVDDFGTEEFVDAAVEAGERDVAIPVGNETVYKPNLRAKLEMAPDSPDGDGDYIVRQTNGQNSYIPLVEVKELPDFPSNGGSYKLRCTVTNGTATLSWVSDS